MLIPPLLLHFSKRFATHLGGGSTQNGRTSIAKRLGVKRGHGATVSPTHIIVRQRGFRWKPGQNVVVGRDHTFNAAVAGRVRMERDHEKKETVVHVDEAGVGRREIMFQEISKYFRPQKECM
jgi:large subunit ribosomal protein L27